MPEISVIVPAFNSEATLERCVEGLLLQTFRNFELIIVDDGSSDGTAVLCDNLASQDTRISVIHQSNRGVGAARNAALDIAKGDYICFVDSDDEVLPGYLQNLISKMEDSVDIVGTSYISRHDGQDSVCVVKNIYRHNAPWAKMFRRRIIEEYGIRFPIDIPQGEDAIFLFNYLRVCAGGIVLSDKSDYVYNALGTNALTAKSYDFPKERYIFDSVSDSIDYLLENRAELSKEDIEQLYAVKGSYCKRALNALYQGKTRKLSERFSFLQNIDKRVLKSIPFNYSGRDIKSSVYQFLLTGRMLMTYDLLRRIFSTIHRK